MPPTTNRSSLGTLLVVAAPSGAGKSSLVAALLGSDPQVALSISHTTRPPRPHEPDGQQYHFVGREEFERDIDAGIFLEHAEVHGNLYGTSRAQVDALLAQGRDVLLEIDWQGAAQVRLAMAGCVSVFILPPSRAELERRLRGRASDSEDVIGRRLRNSRSEIEHARDFDYIMVNDLFPEALKDLQAIVQAVRQRSDIQLQRHAGLIVELLAAGP